uniref:Uncharacterized protein n=1 Tax=Pavo cristatus TaxID=9049 RepID=A0A8C9EXM8_PAVCR
MLPSKAYSWDCFGKTVLPLKDLSLLSPGAAISYYQCCSAVPVPGMVGLSLPVLSKVPSALAPGKDQGAGSIPCSHLLSTVVETSVLGREALQPHSYTLSHKTLLFRIYVSEEKFIPCGMLSLLILLVLLPASDAVMLR